MSPFYYYKMAKTYDIRNGKTLSEEQYIIYLEGMAEMYYLIENYMTDCWHSKSYDPLFIDGIYHDGTVPFHSYYLELGQAGRHGQAKSLKFLYDKLYQLAKELGEENKIE